MSERGAAPTAATAAGGGSDRRAGEGQDTPEAEPAEVQDVFGGTTKHARRYVDILLDRGITWGLLGPREGGRVWSRHVLNCAAISGLVPAGVDVVDVGSGAGLPGIPLALARPDLGLTLLEPLQRRAEFLEQTVEDLGLSDRVRVVRGRAEEHRDRYDVVTSRAVGALGKTLPWCLPLVQGTGQLVLLKGSSAQREVDAAGQQIRRAGLSAEVLSVRAHPRSEPTTAVRLRRP